MKNEYCVYKHTTPCGKVYIGITCQRPEARWRNGKGYKNNLHFWRAICLYGWDNIKHEIIRDNISKEEACEKEKELIALYDSASGKNGYNLTLGGDGVVGITHSEYSKMLMSKARKGKHHTQEHIQHIKENHKGFIGHKHSDESKLRISNNQKKRIRNIETGEIFDGAIDASKKYNIKLQSITAVCRMERKTAGGFHWEYIN